MSTYRVSDPVPSAVAEALHNYPALLQQLLFNRDITTAAAAEAFLAPDYEAHTHDPFLLPDMQLAVERIITALEKKERIAIYSDYDCDGIPGGVVLHDLFAALEHESFINHIPHRHYDGFGLHEAAVEALAADGVKLIITVDCGTSDIAAVERARSLGVDVIITDHHQPGKQLPNAVAVVNPSIGDSYPFAGLCGAAVAYKMAQAVLASVSHSVTPGYEKWWLDMVGIATIADMVPLVDENRVFAHYGLQVLRKSRRPGLQQLFKKQRANQRFLTEDDIGFTIGPRINAASRMDAPEDAFHLLRETDIAKAGAYVEHLETLNNERKGVVATMTKEVHKRLKDVAALPDVLVLGNPAWRPSLVGLTANKLAEEYKRPAFVWGRDGNGKIKGSCRSDGTVSVYKIMQTAADSFLEFGGHDFAGGFGVSDEAIHQLATALNAAFVSLGHDASIATERIVDVELAIDEVTKTVINDQARLSPFGTGNEKPLYAITHVVPTAVTQFGKGKEHVKLTFDTSGAVQEAIAFFSTYESFTTVPQVGQSCTVLGHVEQSYFMNRLQTRIRIVDIV